MTATLPAPPGAELAEPGPGRVFRAERTVRLSDVDPKGRVRFDAVARYLQDVATDDVRDAGVEDAIAWVVRRTTISTARRPKYGERMQLATWCSGTGSALAERRTSIEGEWGSRVETVSLWVSLDRDTLRPMPLDGPHFDPYRGSAGDRRVRARFLVPGPPENGAGGGGEGSGDGAGGERGGGVAVGGARGGRPWPLRHSDIDLFGHVNNVVAWTAVEEEARRLAGRRALVWGQVEYRRAIEPDELPRLVGAETEGTIGVWLLGPDGAPAVSARLGWAGG